MTTYSLAARNIPSPQRLASALSATSSSRSSGQRPLAVSLFRACTSGLQKSASVSMNASGDSASKLERAALELQLDRVRSEGLFDVLAPAPARGRRRERRRRWQVRPIVAQKRPMKPSAAQLPSTIVPQRRQTRTSSAAMSSWRGANWTTRLESTLSKRSSPKRQLRVPRRVKAAAARALLSSAASSPCWRKSRLPLPLTQYCRAEATAPSE